MNNGKFIIDKDVNISTSFFAERSSEIQIKDSTTL